MCTRIQLLIERVIKKRNSAIYMCPLDNKVDPVYPFLLKPVGRLPKNNSTNCECFFALKIWLRKIKRSYPLT